MKQLLKTLFGRYTYLLLASICLFSIAFLLNKYIIGSTSARYYEHLIQNKIQQKQRDFIRLSADTSLIGSLIDQDYTEQALEKLLDQEKGYQFFIYEKTDTVAEPRLLFWNTQVVVPPVGEYGKDEEAKTIYKNNGYYVYSSKTLNFRNGRKLFAEALIPVMWKYFVENENLKKEFIPYEAAIKSVDLTLKPTDFPVNDINGNTLFYLQRLSIHERETNVWSIALVIIGFFMVFLYLHQAAHNIGLQYGLWYGVLFLVSFIILLRFGTYSFPTVLDLRQFELFDPSIYGSSYVLSSLGDLFINSLLICWIVIFINRRINISVFSAWRTGWKNWVSVAFVLTLLVIITFTLSGILQSMVADAKISFNVTNFFSLTQYSFIGFVIMATLALSYFFLSQILVTIAGKLVGEKNYFIFIISAALGLLLLSFIRNTSMVELDLYVLIWLLIFVWLMQQKIFSGFNLRLNVSEVLFWLFVFSFSMSAVIIFENGKIETEQRKRFAQKLYTADDPNSERLLSIALAYLDSNFLNQNFDRFRRATSNAELKDSIINRNFTPYINKYDTKIFTFDSQQHPLFNEDRGSFDTLNTIFRVQGKETSTLNLSGLRYFERAFDKFSYIYKKEVSDTPGKITGYFFVLSDPKKYKSEALVPELFKETRELVPDYSPVYSYAVYDTFKLREHYNDYAFPFSLTENQVPKDEFTVFKKGAYDELWYHPLPLKMVVIAKKNNSFIEAITLFAYLFSTFLFLLSFYRFVAFLIRSRLQWSSLRQQWQLNIRSQIHSTIIMVSLLSFIVIGIATILFFIDRYNRNNQDRLTRAGQIMVKDVKNKLNQYKSFIGGLYIFDPAITDDMERVVNDISEIHGMDVNIYDTLGNLKLSSSPDIYENGVLSRKMNPLAYYRIHTLRQVQSVTNEKVGKVNYLSVYTPVLDDGGKAIAYLNIPSYSTQGELKQEISNFLVTIINLNAFIFLIAGTIALFITNRITSSFTIISQKMRDINLRKMNEVIEWKRNDEIGVLVKEYNKMVKKLEESAEALAKSEREGAWRQMARQVAHEIKNPLTPMKLSIQYLQKAIDNNSPDVKGMTTSVAKTLIEQIDHLSKIASDFSQFANIGNPKNEVFDLHEMLSSLASLYEATENLDFKWERLNQRVLLFADKTQLNRLFTNLLQNAIEASVNRHRRMIRIHEELNGEYITVSITDNGEGIPQQTQSRIFTPNFTTKSSGTGLGLAMSKSIAEQAHGDIWFKTKEQEGTTFYVKLPLLRAMN